MLNPFKGTDNTTISLSVTASNTQGTVTGNGTVLLLTNLGSNTCYFRTGTAAATATTADRPVLPNSQVLVPRGTMQPTETCYVAAICAATESCTLKVTPGYGD